MTAINPGDLVRLTVTFTNSAGAVTDPTTVRVRIKQRDGSEVVYTYPATVVKDSTGVYHADFTVVQTGTHYYRWEGTGAVQVAEEAPFVSVSEF